MKRFILICALLALVMLTPLLSLSYADEVRINFWQFSIDEKLSKKILSDFHTTHPQIKIQMQQLSWDFGHDKIVTSLIAGNAPDIFEIGSTWGPKFAKSGSVDLGKVINEAIFEVCHI